MDHGILFDHARTARIGLPEAVFCEGKPFEALVELLSSFGRGSGHPVLFTRLAPDVFARVPAEIRAEYDYHPLSRTAFGDALPPKGKGRVAVISAGTADGFVAWEAARTLAYLGIGHKLFEDCGVAGLWRLAGGVGGVRSGEGRGGEEGRTPWAPDPLKKKNCDILLLSVIISQFFIIAS